MSSESKGQPLEVGSETLMTTENLVKEYSRRRVVNGVSLKVGAGEIVGLLGPNGSGKTTTFNMVVGVVRPDDGDVVFQGDKITRAPMEKRALRGMGYLTQEPSVFRKLTVEQNILAILERCNMMPMNTKSGIAISVSRSTSQ